MIAFIVYKYLWLDAKYTFGFIYLFLLKKAPNYLFFKGYSAIN